MKNLLKAASLILLFNSCQKEKTCKELNRFTVEIRAKQFCKFVLYDSTQTVAPSMVIELSPMKVETIELEAYKSHWIGFQYNNTSMELYRVIQSPCDLIRLED